jgi:hypothetical protein
MKSPAFWDIKSCCPQEVNRRFEATFCLYLQGRRISQARKQHEGDGYYFLQAGFLLGLFFNSEDGDEHQSTFSRLYGIMSQRVGLFIR